MKRISQIFCKVFYLLVCGFLFQTRDGYANPVDNSAFSLCLSKDCVRHAHTIIKNMNPDIDPCEDFYSFACGGYKKKFGENESRSVYDDTWESLQLQIKDLLENLKPEEGSSSAKLKTVFENCMDAESSKIKAVSDAVDFLNYVGIPNWPKLNDSFVFMNLSRTLGVLAAYEEFAFAGFKPSPYKTKLTDPNVLQSVLILQESFLLNRKEKPKNVHDAVLRIMNYFNVDKNDTDNIWQEFTEIENVGIRLQNEDSGSVLLCRSTAGASYREVNCSKDTFGSTKFLCDFWRSAVEAGDLHKYYSPDILHISCSWSHYIENIFQYLQKINERSLANYLSLRFFISHVGDLNMYLHSTKTTYPKDKRPKTPQPIKRWEFCVGWIIKSMNSALGFEYTQKILTKPMQNSVLDIIKDYTEELDYSIKNLNWLGEKMKSYLQKQLKNLDIGFRKTVDNYRNKTLIESFYKMFSPRKGSFLTNVLEYQKMSQVADEKPLFNSFYSSSDPYTMDFGASVLQPPTFSYELPKIFNYAALGFVIGHELGHNLKSFFDFVHMEESTEKLLDNKIQCFVQQYSQYVAKKTGKMLLSSEAKEEFIADNLGWMLTEQIIKKIRSNENTELRKLPSLNYTPLQLAYISFAQDSCAVLSKSLEAEFYATKPENLLNLRVNGVLQNSKTFSDIFKCGQEDVMNPQNKCTFFE